MNQAQTTEVPVFGIGASAGGLTALRDLLREIPPGFGGALLIVQHRDPNRDSLLATILDKVTQLAVVEIDGDTTIRPDCIYIAPPGKYLDFERNTVRVAETPGGRLGRTPIDHLFSELAIRGGAAATGVVLSGTGTDGALGVRQIKASGGSVLVQDPAEAEFDGMPRAAINTGCADVVSTATDLADRIVKIAGHGAGKLVEDDPETTLESVLSLISSTQGFDFSGYKQGTLGRRIGRRMGLHDIPTIADYLEYLKSRPDEQKTLAKDLLIGVTRFFRDEEVWTSFGEIAVDGVISEMSDGDTLRAWAAGCASGEEAYTMAIVIRERIEASGKSIQPIVFATDLNADAIDRARTGRYHESSLSDMDAERIQRWFQREGDECRVIPDLRENLVFAAQNAISDPPFSSLDLISCRNLLIYIDSRSQSRLLETFHFALKTGGYLMLGLSESADRATSLFQPIDKKLRIYRRIDGQRRGELAHTATSTPGAARVSPPQDSFHSNRLAGDPAVRAMLLRFAPPAVLVDANFDVQRFHGEVLQYFDFRRGVMSGNIVSVLKDALQARVWTALQTAKREGRVTEARIMLAGDGVRPVQVVIEPVEADRAPQMFNVYFIAGDSTEADPHAEPIAFDDTESALVSEYQSEIELLRGELQTVIEKGETAYEELQAANEEVMSANEELQSSNEELETSREELQSLNEELCTINAELEDKVLQLEATNDDLANLIASTDIATIFLDTNLCIRRYSAKTADLLTIRDSDIGRPLAELKLRIDDPTILTDVRTVLERLEGSETSIIGPDYAYLRRIVPYRTQSSRIEGVVITFSDIARIHNASVRLALQAARQASIAELGELALAAGAVEPLFDRAVADIGEHVAADFVEVQALTQDRKSFNLTAGHGWPRGVVHHTLAPNEVDSYPGYVVRRMSKIETVDFESETRFDPSQLIADQGIRCGACIPIGPTSSPWGVLGAWRSGAENFDDEERHFLAAVAKILWLAVSRLESRRVQERERQELQALLDGLPIMIGVVDETQRFEMVNVAFESIGVMPDEARRSEIIDVLGATAAQNVTEMLASARSGQVEVTIPVPGHRPRTFLMHCVARVSEGLNNGFYFAATDIEERKQWEERNRLISAELDHRVKNILALVNTIARMTGTNSSDVQSFRKIFSERIQSLSRAHAALARSRWTGMNIGQLLRDELDAYGSGDVMQFTISGPDIDIGPRATQSLALAFHELATNAARYGALSEPSGKLDITWRLEPESFEFRWEESGLSNVGSPQSEGFGSTVVKSAVETQLRGGIDMEFRPTGLVCDIRIPIEELEIGRYSGDGGQNTGG